MAAPAPGRRRACAGAAGAGAGADLADVVRSADVADEPGSASNDPEDTARRARRGPREFAKGGLVKVIVCNLCVFLVQL